MKTPPPIHGLRCEIAAKRSQASGRAEASREERKSMATKREAAEDADRLAQEADTLAKWVDEDVDLINQIEVIADWLRGKKTTTTYREDALRYLDGASSSLRREVGDAPETNSKP